MEEIFCEEGSRALLNLANDSKVAVHRGREGRLLSSASRAAARIPYKDEKPHKDEKPPRGALASTREGNRRRRVQNVGHYRMLDAFQGEQARRSFRHEIRSLDRSLRGHQNFAGGSLRL